MFKFESASLSPQKTDLPSSIVDDGRKPLRRAVLAWGEHCVECAAPACYQTCDLFKPTRNGSCRRFENGIQRHVPAGPRAHAVADIKFRRWGKLEAQGNARLLPATNASIIEGVLGVVWPRANQLGSVLARATGDGRWNTIMEALHKRLNDRLRASARSGPLPETFLAEISNPTDVTVHLSLAVTVDSKRLTRIVPVEQLPPPRHYSITVPPGFSRHEIPVKDLADILVSGLPFNLAIVPVGDATPHLLFHTLELVSFGGAVQDNSGPAKTSSAAPGVKCVVFDLDNTLWNGVLLEGPVQLRPGTQELFKTLDERGILISVVSKNARDDAMTQLEAFGLSEYLLYPMISWRPKSESLKALAKALDIGIDTLLFVDDNPFEREEVATALPTTAVLPDTEIPNLTRHARLQGAVTAESRTRRQMYRHAMVREELASQFSGDYRDFLKSCNITVEIRPDGPADFERIVELVQRTNQLNFSGRKYSRDDISAILGDPTRGRYVVAVSDKFGSYGTVGFCLARHADDGVYVEDFMLSCRVQGKFIEQALFWYLTEFRGSAAPQIHVDFRRTERNRAAELVMETLQFQPDATGGLSRVIEPGAFAVDFLTIDTREIATV